MDIVSGVMAYEVGELGARQELELFSELVKSGLAWTFQGHYGRMARAMIDQGFLYENGDISSFALDTLADWEADGADYDARNDDELVY